MTFRNSAYAMASRLQNNFRIAELLMACMAPTTCFFVGHDMATSASRCRDTCASEPFSCSTGHERNPYQARFENKVRENWQFKNKIRQA